MAVFYNDGETKKRPGIYQRHVNTGFDTLVGAQDGICAIPIQSFWGPLNVVMKNTSKTDLYNYYGRGEYGDDYTVPAAEEMFNGGASTVYTYRMGTGGKEATKEITTGLTATAKYVGNAPISVAIKSKIGDESKKQMLVYFGSELVETIEFAAGGTGEGQSLIDAAASSKFVTITGDPAPESVPVVDVASGALTGGGNPTVTNGDYSSAFAALETYYYNTITIDVDDDESVTLGLLLQSYLSNAYLLGKLGIAVVGEKTTVDFETRCEHARSFNDAKVVYLGGGYMSGSESKDGVMAICRTAGIIASTPANQGITHYAVNGATDLCENLTYSQYEQAIDSGMLLFSMSPDGTIWYDSGINTLITPEPSTQDDGWKKIRRVKTRFEIIDRIDRTLLPKVGRVSADSDGVADIIQSAQRVLDSMANNEGKLFQGATFTEDPNNPYEGDSAWFIIQADDIDSLEKIYIRYTFRYSQNS